MPPGGTASVVHLGVVHPQLALAFSITKGAVPSLMNTNSCVTGFPTGPSGKLNSLSVNLILEPSGCATGATTGSGET